MPFTKGAAASLHAKPEKHKLHFSAASSLTSETRHFDALTHNYTSTHTQVFEIHYAFGSAHVKIGVANFRFVNGRCHFRDTWKFF